MTQQETRPAVLSTLKRIISTVLPPVVYRFLFSQSEEFPVARLLFRALFGALSGSALYLGVFQRIPLTFDLQQAVGGIFVAVCALAGALSSSSRCLIILMFPSMLGSRGRACLMLFTLSVLCSGPVSNIQRNVETAAVSLSCNLDLQVRHAKLLWRDAIRPALLIAQELKDNEEAFQSEALAISREFQTIREEVLHQFGYDSVQPEHPDFGRSTQEQFTAQTMMQCDRLVDAGVQRCVDWFKLKLAECMKAIPVPTINHILCMSMKFHFLCDVMRVMTPWCREQIPVEGNFGQMFDQLNLSMDLLSREFSTRLAVQEQQQQSVLVGQDFTRAVQGSLQELASTMETLLYVLQLLLSLTFITIFTQALGYLRRYRRDIWFDNRYISSSWRQLDARRRREGSPCLLPLEQSEKKVAMDPWRLKIHPDELRDVTSGVFQVLSVTLLSIVLMVVDFSLFHVLDIVSRHTFTQFNLTSSHQVDIKVSGDSMMARLLRKTVSAFNSTSRLEIQMDNQECVSPPSSLSAGVYVSIVCCVLLAVLLSCLQVYTNRLRHAIADIYHPEREQKRVYFLYHLLLQRRLSSSDRKHMGEGRRSQTVLQHLTRWGRRICGLQ